MSTGSHLRDRAPDGCRSSHAPRRYGQRLRCLAAAGTAVEVHDAPERRAYRGRHHCAYYASGPDKGGFSAQNRSGSYRVRHS